MSDETAASSTRRRFLAHSAAVAGAVAAGVALTDETAAAAPAPGGLGAGAFVAPADGVPSDLTELTIAGSAALLRSGAISVVDLVDAHLDRIRRFDGIYQAFNTVLADEARAAAKAASGRPGRHPLSGIPLAIKDNYYSAGVRTTANSYIFQSFVPPFDATALAKLKAAGAIVLGKTQMGPLATTRATTPNGVVTTVNAWAPNDPSVDPAGSSSGSGCAVAARLATSSTGTQTGGSIIGPSNAEGLTGLKPTMGRVSLRGIIPLSYTRDHPGPLARDALDAAIMLATMAGEDPGDFRTQGLPEPDDYVRAATPVRRRGSVVLRRRTRIGVLPGYTSVPAGANASTVALASARKAMLDTLADIPGAQVVDVTLPDEWDLLTGNDFNNVRLSERTEEFRRFLQTDLKLFGVSLLGWLQGLFVSGDEWITGQRAKLLLAERVLDDLFGQCDVVVQTGPVPFDILGLPEIAFPIGFAPAPTAPKGLPLGGILGGQPYGEARLLEVVAAYQAVTTWHLQRPADPVLPAPAASSRARAAAPAAAPQLRLTPEQALLSTE